MEIFIMIRILTTMYNAERFIGRTIQSIKAQTEQEWKCYITNDLSTDNCLQAAERNIAGDDRFVIINNKKKQWQSGNYYQVCHLPEIDDHDICVELDGDDFFPDENVLTRVKTYYEDENVWMTYGSFVFYDGGKFTPGFAKPPVGGFANQRMTAFTTSHLRTWKTALFRKLTMADLTEDNGVDFIPYSCDLYFFQNMLEMAGEKHAKFITDVNYAYNDNDLSEARDNMSNVYHYTNKAKTRTPKKEIDKL